MDSWRDGKSSRQWSLYLEGTRSVCLVNAVAWMERCNPLSSSLTFVAFESVNSTKRR